MERCIFDWDTNFAVCFQNVLIDLWIVLYDKSPNGAIERNAYRRVEFGLMGFVHIIRLACFRALYRARSSQMLGNWTLCPCSRIYQYLFFRGWGCWLGCMPSGYLRCCCFEGVLLVRRQWISMRWSFISGFDIFLASFSPVDFKIVSLFKIVWESRCWNLNS